ncbi:hypothetical protein RRG08_061978 [Elysia crispata]|uniref:Uncharacterized protein n=1 Tax=Elysia crispata TaxID=231223 RepID=A0AAE1A4X6_9GAST|nr:hypothetical protein RRG08_061978 [Elysia crispata]
MYVKNSSQDRGTLPELENRNFVQLVLYLSINGSAVMEELWSGEDNSRSATHAIIFPDISEGMRLDREGHQQPTGDI